MSTKTSYITCIKMIDYSIILFSYSLQFFKFNNHLAASGY